MNALFLRSLLTFLGARNGSYAPFVASPFLANLVRSPVRFGKAHSYQLERQITLLSKKPCNDYVPIYHGPKVFEVLRAGVTVIDVVRVFPDVTGEKRYVF